MSDADSYIGRRVTSAFANARLSADITGSARNPAEGSNLYDINGITNVRVATQSDIVVLNLLGSAREASVICEALRNTIGPDRTIVVVSSLLTWDRGTHNNQTATSAASVRESEWAKRRAAPVASSLFAAENALLSLAKGGCRVHVVACGLPFGDGEGPLFSACRASWSGKSPSGPGIPTSRTPDGSNAVPTVHVIDLANYVVKVALSSAAGGLDSGPGTGYQQPLRYSIAVDGSAGTSTAADVMTAVSSAIGNGRAHFISPPRIAGYNDSRSNNGASLPSTGAIGDGDASEAMLQAYLAANIRIEDPAATCAMHADQLVSLQPSEWRCREGLVASARTTLAPEFVAAHSLSPVRIVIAGAPSSGKSHMASVLSQRYNVPLITVQSAIAMITAPHCDIVSLADSPQRLASVTALQAAVQRYYALAASSSAAALTAEPAAAAGAAKGGKPPAAAAGGKADAKAKAGDAKAGGAHANAGNGAGDAASHGDPYATMAARAEPRLPRSLLTRLLRAVLTSPMCKTKGYVLDGYPRTALEAQALFGFSGDSNNGDDGIAPVAGLHDFAVGSCLPERWSASLGDDKDDDEDTLLSATAAATAGGGSAWGVPGFQWWKPTEGRQTSSTSPPAESYCDEQCTMHPAVCPSVVLVLDAADDTLRARFEASSSGVKPSPVDATPVPNSGAGGATSASTSSIGQHAPLSTSGNSTSQLTETQILAQHAAATARFNRRLRRARLHLSVDIHRSIPSFFTGRASNGSGGRGGVVVGIDGRTGALVGLDSLQPGTAGPALMSLSIDHLAPGYQPPAEASDHDGHDDDADGDENGSQYNGSDGGDSRDDVGGHAAPLPPPYTVARSSSLLDRHIAAGAVARDVAGMGQVDAAMVVLPEHLPEPAEAAAQQPQPHASAASSPQAAVAIDLAVLAAIEPVINIVCINGSSGHPWHREPGQGFGPTLEEREAKIREMIEERERRLISMEEAVAAETGVNDADDGAAASTSSKQVTPVKQQHQPPSTTSSPASAAAVRHQQQEQEREAMVALRESLLLEKRTAGSRAYLASTLLPALATALVTTAIQTGVDDHNQLQAAATAAAIEEGSASGDGAPAVPVAPLDRLAAALYAGLQR